MLFFILIQALLMLPLKGTVGQEIIFDLMKPKSPCTQGLRNWVDNFTFTGTIGKDAVSLIRADWSIHVFIQLSVSPSQWTVICQISVGEDGNSCKPSQQRPCYCDHINTATGSAHFVMNFRARQSYGQGIIRAYWTNKKGPVYYSTSTAPLPVVYDVKKATLVLKVNDKEAVPISAPIGVHFISHQNNNVELCCSNTASPCYPRMSFNGQDVQSEATCSTHTVFVPDVTYKATVKLSYSVCSKSDVIPAGSSVITTVQGATTTSETTTTATTSQTTSQNTTNQITTTATTQPWRKPTEPKKDSTALVVILSVLLVVLLIVLIVVATLYYIKKRSNKQKFQTETESGPIEKHEEEEAEQQPSETNLEIKTSSIAESQVW